MNKFREMYLKCYTKPRWGDASGAVSAVVLFTLEAKISCYMAHCSAKTFNQQMYMIIKKELNTNE